MATQSTSRDDGLAFGEKAGDGEGHGDAVVAKALHGGAVERCAAEDFQPVFGLGDLCAHGAEIRRDGGEAVGFFHAELAGVGNHRRAMGEGGGHGEDGEFIDDIGDLATADDRAFQSRALDVHGAERLGFLALDDFADVGAHPDEDAEDAGARLIESDVFNEQLRARLRGGGDHPEGGAGNIAGHREIARFRGEAAVDRDGEFLPLRADEKILEHPLGVVAALRGLGDAGPAIGEKSREEHGAFDLRAGHGGGVVQRGELAAFNDERGTISGAFSANLRAHLPERFDDPLHGPFRE